MYSHGKPITISLVGNILQTSVLRGAVGVQLRKISFARRKWRHKRVMSCEDRARGRDNQSS
jgi:hypothetical protein